MNAALVPAKRLGSGKSRLVGVLEREALEALIVAMLGDVVTALLAAPEVDCVAVVTPDATVGEAAVAAGARALVRPDPGLNPALDAAGAELTRQGAEALLVVLGDVAGASARDVSALFAALDALGGRGAVLAPARDGGTAALLRAPPDAIPNRFGIQSAAAHRDAAAESGVPYRELALPSLSIDVDRPEDLKALLRGEAEAPRTRALLGSLGLGEFA